MTHDLARMQRIALALLAGAAALYALASWLEPRHPAWGYAAAFGEAAMIGAIADWFAVVALFRHPLGLPIPHTAIIPASKDRIGENLAGFIVTHFLGPEQVRARLRSFDAPRRLAGWLVAPGHADAAAARLGAALRNAIDALDDVRVRGFVRQHALHALDRLDLARLAGDWLALLTHEGRHRPVLDLALRRLAALLNHPEIKARLAEVIAAEVQVLRYLGLDTVAGRYATRKIAAGVTRLVREVAADPAHPLRAELDALVARYIERLRGDAALRGQVRDLHERLLANPALAGYVQGLWGDVVAWLRHDLDRPESVMRQQAAAALCGAGTALNDDAGLRAWLQDQLLAAVPRWVEQHGDDVRRHIVERVHAWDPREMTEELERHIGRDLQFIRINGTLVGGLVGLLIHGATQLVRALG
jgi:uncharacterized membrane-anchored protein YjiN (DUF445 family)